MPAEPTRFYRGTKVFVTGHTGFKGAWLTAFASRLGADVKGYALAPESDDALHPRIAGPTLGQSVIADIRDRERLAHELRSFEPRVIFHLAAQSLVLRSYEHPLETLDVNVLGTANLLDAARALPGPCAIVVVTTDKVYEPTLEGPPRREEDPLGGVDPYSASKAAAELVVRSYERAFLGPRVGKPVATARSGNVIGGGDVACDRLLPDVVRALRTGQPVMLRHPEAVRPFQHVLEPLAGYLALAERLVADPERHAGAYNFGPAVGDHRTVRQLVERAIAAFGGGRYVVAENGAAPVETRRLELDAGKAARLLGVRPRWSTDEAIDRAVRFYADEATCDARALVARDLDAFLAAGGR